jgi:hypothetical protein
MPKIFVFVIKMNIQIKLIIGEQKYGKNPRAERADG